MQDFSIDYNTRDFVLKDSITQMENDIYNQIYIAIFTNAKAPKELVKDKKKRRGWCGDNYLTNDRFGSLLWFYTWQSILDIRLLQQIKQEIENKLAFLKIGKLVNTIIVDVSAVNDRILIIITADNVIVKEFLN